MKLDVYSNAVEEVMLPRQVGVVIWFNAAKGFGFISRQEGPDIFVHYRQIKADGYKILAEGQRVSFSVGNGTRGLHAEDVLAIE